MLVIYAITPLGRRQCKPATLTAREDILHKVQASDRRTCVGTQMLINPTPKWQGGGSTLQFKIRTG